MEGIGTNSAWFWLIPNTHFSGWGISVIKWSWYRFYGDAHHPPPWQEQSMSILNKVGWLFRISSKWHPTPVLLPGKSHGQRSLVGCSPRGREESDTTERRHVHFSLSCIGEGHGNPLQCSCLENLRGGGVWWADVYGIAQSQTRLKQLSSSSSNTCTFLRRRKIWISEEKRHDHIDWKKVQSCIVFQGKTNLSPSLCLEIHRESWWKFQNHFSHSWLICNEIMHAGLWDFRIKCIPWAHPFPSVFFFKLILLKNSWFIMLY